MFQIYFNMAILWWVASGTYNKMERDVRSAFPEQSYWIREEKRGEVPLHIDNLLLWFIILGFSLMISSLVFFGEIAWYKNKKFLKKRLNTHPQPPILAEAQEAKEELGTGEELPSVEIE